MQLERTRALTPYHSAVIAVPTPNPRHTMNPPNERSFLSIRGAFSASDGHRKRMESRRIKLDPQTVEAIARRVVEILEGRGLQQRELVDASELARRFGIERSWVYSHAIELGAVKLGNGAKPRLRFDPQIAVRVLRRVDGKPAADPPARSGKRAGQPQGSEGKVELLPIRGSGESGSPSAA